jgi:hypothetical protein
MLLAEIAEDLTPAERRLVNALFAIDPDKIDDMRSSLREQKDFLICTVVSVGDLHCPFELDFGRQDNLGRFNFYVGLGAELYAFQDIVPIEVQQALALDVEKFLRSRIRCERRIKNGVVIRETYRGDLPMIAGLALRASYKRGPSLVFGYERQAGEYGPWL